MSALDGALDAASRAGCTTLAIVIDPVKPPQFVALVFPLSGRQAVEWLYQMPERTQIQWYAVPKQERVA